MSEPHLTTDSRIHVTLPQLVRLQNQVTQIKLLSARYSRAHLSGRYQSHQRGRGLNFEELRHYQLGDDIRQMDWKVTQRTGKPHVRSYTEEKDHQVIVCVDQRSGMYFGSVSYMKSVVAAEIAALVSWLALANNDRVGFFISACQELSWSSTKRGNAHFLMGLNQLVAANQMLSSASYDHDRVGFRKWMDRLSQRRLKAATLIIISDFSDADAQSLKQLKYLQQHNDVLSIFISDPLEVNLPEQQIRSAWVVGDGRYQLALQKGKQTSEVNKRLHARYAEKQTHLKSLMAAQHMPFIEITTHGDHLVQLAQTLRGIQ
ncbi:DUF58 domain-containing protein [Vibrio fluvialis]|nr:DUF58 domain-containing protein [Vibrio fluvialis]MBY8222222.1 DUF58 domain-containing protein [Vibrio fluvialis]